MQLLPVLLAASFLFQTRVAFVDVSLIPMDREPIVEHQTILARGDRLEAIGPAGTMRLPAGTTRIAGRGNFLLPGLTDMPTHLLSDDRRGQPCCSRRP